jgi:hypothetical protein
MVDTIATARRSAAFKRGELRNKATIVGQANSTRHKRRQRFKINLRPVPLAVVVTYAVAAEGLRNETGSPSVADNLFDVLRCED